MPDVFFSQEKKPDFVSCECPTFNGNEASDLWRNKQKFVRSQCCVQAVSVNARSSLAFFTEPYYPHYKQPVFFFSIRDEQSGKVCLELQAPGIQKMRFVSLHVIQLARGHKNQVGEQPPNLLLQRGTCIMCTVHVILLIIV